MKLIRHNQGSPDWHAWRFGGLGGSDIAAVLNLSPYTDPPHNRETLFREKVTGVERPANYAMNRGKRFEPHARLAYETRCRCTAPPVCVQMQGCEWARVSLDGLCSNGAAINPLRWILELKCPSWEVHDAALAGVVASHFEVQCQWQLLVCGLDRLDFASFNPGERFTPRSWPLFGAWEDRVAAWLKVPKCDRGQRPELLDLWLELPPALRPAHPADWLAVQALAPDAEKQAWIMEEAARFWFEVLEARAAFDKEAGKTHVIGEAELA